MAYDPAERFENRKSEIEHERLKAEELKAQANAIKLKTDAQLARIKQGLPSPESCADCWIDDGIDSRWTAMRTPSHNPSKFDRWLCEQCGYTFDRPWR